MKTLISFLLILDSLYNLVLLTFSINLAKYYLFEYGTPFDKTNDSTGGSFTYVLIFGLIIVYLVISNLVWFSISKTTELKLNFNLFNLIFIPIIFALSINFKIVSVLIMVIFSFFQLYNIPYLNFKNWNKVFPHDELK